MAVSTRGLIAHVRHVAHDPGIGRAATNCRRVTDHVVHRHGQGLVVAEHGHAEAVADEDHVNARLILQIGGGIIVAGQPGDGLSVCRLF